MTIFKGVPQGFVFGSPLVNVFTNAFFLSLKNSHLSNYANDNTLYCYGKMINEVNEKLKLDFKLVTAYFHENQMLLNFGKCRYICLGSKTEKAEFWIFEKSKEESILCVNMDNKLTFYIYIKGLCMKGLPENYSFIKNLTLLDSSKKSLIFKSVIKSHLSYYKLISVFSPKHSKT